MKNDEIDLFALAKSVDIKSYIESFYPVEFDNKNFATCPFCGSEKTKAFSLEPKKGIVKCFSCMPKALGIVDFVMQMEQCDNLSAVKKICDDMGLVTSDNKPMDEKKQQELAKKREELQKQKEAKRKKEAAAFKRQQKKSMELMAKSAPKMLEDIIVNKEKLKKIFNWTPKLNSWYHEFIGWDEKHQSIAIINWQRSENKIYNIKHQHKYEWDNAKKQFSDKRMPGKWISQAASVIYPFPLEYFESHDDEKVVLCFGEKDSLNLLSLDINNLTLGGISNSFEPFKDMLKDKIVYIFPDNQLIEYLAAMSRYMELKDVAKDVFIVSFSHISPAFAQKYDISDFILEKKFSSKEAFFEAIEYSCFKLTNSFIEDVKNFFYGEDKLLKRLDNFIQKARALNFAQIEDEIVASARPVKSELDAEISSCEMQLKAVKDHSLLDEFKAFLGSKYDGEDFVKNFRLAMEYKASLFGQFRKQYEADVGEAFAKDAKASGHIIATYRNRLYFWTGSHYENVDDKTLKVFIFQKWMKAAKVNKKQQTPDFMNKVATAAFYHGNQLERIRENQNHRVINFENGTAYLHNNGKFAFRNTHLKEDGATSLLPLEYKKNATCPKWKRFLKEVLPDVTEQNALMEFIGYCFLATHSYQKFLFLLGSGANGKSIVLNVIRKFFGESTSNVDLQQLYSHEMIGIEGKYINIGSEINPKGLNEGQMENLKKLTAGEPTQLNPKNSTPYDIKADEIPKFIFSGNTKPKGNLDDGLFRRMLLLNFNKIISKEERIHALEERFSDELSGIFNLAMEGLQRLLSRGDFSMSSDMERNLAEYKEEANPILAYANENIVAQKGVMVSKKLLYAHYKAWSEEKGHHVASSGTFFSRLKDILRDINETQPNYHALYVELIGNRPRFIDGLKVNSESIDLFMINKIEVSTDNINVDSQAKVPIKLEKNA